ncbi:HAD family hydrolase [Ruminococcus albus]|uniref:Putative hydrolase of the HAD superfamily n=1 Tax=Ruminococcus albus TaxID=1264 RepID=A0A1H7LVB7_RUMAL|nr:HAD family hydrolase [Ruminococcus albus]SEL02894.1 putative hydrolase of the HAD superfamily [Ruminococcus albus]
MKSQWLFFDIGSTLVDETKAYEHRILDAIEGTDITYEQFNEKRISFAMQNLRGDLEAIEYFGLKRTPWHSEDEYPYSDADKVLAYLHAKGYKLGVIANQSPGTEERLQNWGLLKYFSTVAASAELGISKPDKAIFLKAFEMSNCTPENATMIGDRLDNDIYPAMELCMKTVWIKQGIAAYQLLDKTKSAPDHIIRTLSELTEIF